MTPLLSVKLNIPEIGGTDIVFHLVEFLDVLDVTRLMMASKSLFQLISTSRLIWLRFVNALISQESLPPYSLNPQAMTVEELSLCATRPLRLKWAVSRGYAMHLKVVCRFEFPDSDDHLPMLFLPGGRVLVTMTNEGGNGSVNLWDMQTSVAWDCPHYCQPARPVARFRLGLSDVFDPKLGFSYQYHPEERRVVLLYNSHSGNSSIYRISFLEWKDSSGQPTIIVGPSLRMDELFEVDGTEAKPLGHYLENDIVCVWYKGIVCIWDWKQNTWAWLRVSDYIPSAQMALPYHGMILSANICLFPQMQRWFVRIEMPYLGPVDQGPHLVESAESLRIWTGGNPTALPPGPLNLKHQDPWCRRCFNHLVIDVGDESDVYGPHLEIDVSSLAPGSIRTKLVSQVHSTYPFGASGGFRKLCTSLNGFAAIEVVSYNPSNHLLVSTAAVTQWTTNCELEERMQAHLLGAPCRVTGYALLQKRKASGSDEMILIRFE